MLLLPVKIARIKSCGLHAIASLIGLFTLAPLCLLLQGCATDTPVPPVAQKGVLDLTTWSFQSQGPASLDGEWSFYWNRLLIPKDFKTLPPPGRTGFLNISQLWDGISINGGEPLPRNGTATLRLTVLVPSDLGIMGLQLSSMTPAFRLWVDNRLVTQLGVVGKTRGTERPDYGNKSVYFQPRNGKFTLTLQLSSHNLMGVNLPSPAVSFSTQEQLIEKNGQQRRVSVILLSILLFMSAYHLVLFVFYRRDSSALYFALFCLMWVVNASMGYIATWLMPALGPWVSVRLIYSTDLLSYYMTVPLLLLFLKAMFDTDVPWALPIWLGTATVLFVFCLLAAQVMGFHPLETGLPRYFHLISVTAIVCVGICLIRALGNRRSGAGLILAGFVAVAIAGSNDMLYDIRVINTGYYTPVGILAFIIFQSFALARRFSSAFTMTEALSMELQQKNITLSRMDQLKDEFLANTSHELRTPLSGIIGITESLLAGLFGPLPDQARHNLNLVAASGRRLTALINDILDFSKLRNQETDLDLKPVDARAVADVVITVLMPLAREKDLVLINQIPKNLPPVRADEDRFQQILYNLLGNAIKFSDQGQISIDAKQRQAWVEFSVKDQGCGIAKEKLEEIFEPFRQADTVARQTGRGVGLGLSITKKLVALHDSDLKVASRPGQGSTFTFSLRPMQAGPDHNWKLHHISKRLSELLPEPQILTPEHSPTRSADDCLGARILVVDDEPVNLQVLVNHLHLSGFHVGMARDGITALEMINNFMPDLVLLDIMMPGITGYAVCQILRKTYGPSELPVIMLTAKNRVQDIVHGFSCGANDYLLKPFEKEVLLARVNTQLEIRKAFQTLLENIKLKKEVARRQQTELELRLNQRRLSGMLDTVPDMVISVNESLEVCFCNKRAASMLGMEIDTLLGQPLTLLFDETWVTSIEKIIRRQTKNKAQASQTRVFEDLFMLLADHKKIRVDITTAALMMDEEQVQVLIIRQTEQLSAASSGGTLEMIQKVNQHQERLRELENTVNDLMPEAKTLTPDVLAGIRILDQTLTDVRKNLTVHNTEKERRRVGVLVMQLAIDYWYEATDLDKVILARESGIWKTYTDKKGYTRTQTLDKYLNDDTLPRQPRWQWISNTAVYVLASCTTPSPLRDHLEKTLLKYYELA